MARAKNQLIRVQYTDLSRLYMYCVAGVVHAGHPGMGAGHGLSLNCLSSVWLAEGYIMGVHVCAFSICIYSYIIFVLYIYISCSNVYVVHVSVGCPFMCLYLICSMYLISSIVL